MFNMQNKMINRKSEQVYTFKCCDCGADVTTTLGEILFYDDKSLVVPKRCKACKDKKKERESTDKNVEVQG